MKKFYFPALIGLSLIGLMLNGCVRQPYVCSDPLGCIEIVEKTDTIQIGALLTLSGPDKSLGEDALRGIEIAIADKKQINGHTIELIQQDDQCSQSGGQQGAAELAANKKILGVIGATCSSASDSAAKIFSDANLLMISPSSTAPSLTDPASHQAAFLRTIYNDKVQGEAIANFAFKILGKRNMATIDDGTPYTKQSTDDACKSFDLDGGQCLQQVQMTGGRDIATVLQSVASSKPDVVYYPVDIADGTTITKDAAAGLGNVILISSDGLLTKDFLQQSKPASEGMYLSGPAAIDQPSDFLAKYKARYGELPVAAYHLQAYDAAMMLFNAIEKVGIPLPIETNSPAIAMSIPLQALHNTLYSTQNMQGLSGVLSCSSNGDCAQQPNIEIYQIVNSTFKPIYP